MDYTFYKLYIQQTGNIAVRKNLSSLKTPSPDSELWTPERVQIWTFHQPEHKKNPSPGDDGAPTERTQRRRTGPEIHMSGRVVFDYIGKHRNTIGKWRFTLW